RPWRAAISRRPTTPAKSRTSRTIAMPPTTKSELTVISAFTTRLALRPDGERVCAVLARELYDRRDALWPPGTEGVTPQWIAGHVFEILALSEQLCGAAPGLPLTHENFSLMAGLTYLLQPLPN